MLRKRSHGHVGGVRDEQANGTRVVLYPGDHLLDGRGVRHVGDGGHAAADPRDLVQCFGRLAVVDDHAGAVGGEPQRRRPPDALGGARDEGDGPFEGARLVHVPTSVRPAVKTGAAPSCCISSSICSAYQNSEILPPATRTTSTPPMVTDRPVSATPMN